MRCTWIWTSLHLEENDKINRLGIEQLCGFQFNRMCWKRNSEQVHNNGFNPESTQQMSLSFSHQAMDPISDCSSSLANLHRQWVGCHVPQFQPYHQTQRRHYHHFWHGLEAAAWQFACTLPIPQDNRFSLQLQHGWMVFAGIAGSLVKLCRNW